MLRAPLLPFVGLLCLLPRPAAATTWHVLPDGSGDAPTLAAALAAAAAGDTVEAACGTYNEHGLALKAGVTVRSETGRPECATVDGQGLGPVFTAVNLPSPAWLRGFTITGGQGAAGVDSGGGGLVCRASPLSVTDCVFSANTSEFGGGAGCYGGAPSFERCRFENNSATSPQWAAGGGMFCKNGAPVLRTCFFTGNTAFSSVAPGDGGGVFAQSTSLKATDCTFLGNSSGAGGGGLYSFSQDAAQVTGCRFQENSSTAGGALYLEESYAEVVDCTFTGNTAANGGALYMSAWSSPVARGCIFLDNAASPNSGGAIDCWHSLPLLEDCEFVGNTAVLDGGALAANGVCQPSLERCRFIDNAAGRNGGAMSGYYATGADLVECTLTGNGAVGQGGGIFYRLGGPLTLDRTIVAFSPDGEALACSESNSITVSCSDVYANAGGDWVACLAGLGGVPGNFSADPLFCDAAAADVALLPDSPCLPANSPCAAQVGAEGPGCGSAVGAGSTMETSSWGRIKARYRGR